MTFYYEEPSKDAIQKDLHLITHLQQIGWDINPYKAQEQATFVKPQSPKG